MVLTQNTARLFNIQSPVYHNQSRIGKQFGRKILVASNFAANVLSFFFLPLFQTFGSPFKHTSTS